MGRQCLGIDLGGTFIKLALLDEQMTIRSSRQLPTPTDRGPEAVIAAMVEVARGLLAEQGQDGNQVVGVGIGSPGPLDLEAGVVIAMPNIPGFQNVPLRDRVGSALHLPTLLENDANAAGLGEYLCGSGVGSRLMVLLTLGTGIGSGIVLGGEVFHGVHGIGAEVGHMIVQPGGEPCGCGQRGCLERYASATYLSRLATRAIQQDGRSSRLGEVLQAKGEITARDVNDARRAGDQLAAEVWDQAARYLAVACVNLCRVLDPDRIVLGGGMAAAGDDLLGPVRRHFEQVHWTIDRPRTTIALAKLGNDAGVIGAAGAAWAKFGK
jgi:glucokinase